MSKIKTEDSHVRLERAPAATAAAAEVKADKCVLEKSEKLLFLLLLPSSQKVFQRPFLGVSVAISLQKKRPFSA
jgi:hypothetical protein